MAAHFRTTLPLAVALITMAFAGCASDSDSDDGATSGTGSASMYVKDAPSDDFAEIHVMVSEAAVHRSSSGATNGSLNGTGTATATATGTSTGIGNTSITASVTVSASATVSPSTSSSPANEAGWVVLFTAAAGVDVDLLNTTGAKAAFLGEADLAAGHYQQIRLTILSAWGIKDDGSRVNITVSSGTLKVVKGFEVEDGMETRITLDIDLEKSLKQQGNGDYRMTPVVGKTSTAVVADAESGEDESEAGDVEDVPESA